MEISATIPVQYNKPNIEYQQTIIKAVIRINDTQQQEILYTYNKNGQLINSVVHKHEISIA